jgi:NADPH2:quinone reductase
VRAVQISELGGTPALTELEGDAGTEVLAVALNPLDLAVAAGRFYGGHPPLPYVPGCEAIVRRGGTRSYLYGGGYGTVRDGFLAERTDCPLEGALVPEDLDDALAAACGIAGIAGWGPIAQRAPVSADDRVLVLGATGSAGIVTVQGARLLGAERIVAAGRDRERLERAKELGADETVQVGGEGLADRLRKACGDAGPTLVVDFLWGEPARAAVAAAAPGARVVQLGQAAGPEAALTSADIRGKQLSILGYSVFGLSTDGLASVYSEIAGHVAAGRIRIDVERYALDEIESAWAAQQRGSKAVVCP